MYSFSFVAKTYLGVFKVYIYNSLCSCEFLTFLWHLNNNIEMWWYQENPQKIIYYWEIDFNHEIYLEMYLCTACVIPFRTPQQLIVELSNTFNWKYDKYYWLLGTLSWTKGQITVTSETLLMVQGIRYCFSTIKIW